MEATHRFFRAMKEGPDELGTLSSFQFVLITTLISGTPFGTEYLVEAVGTGYTLLFSLVLIIALSYPVALISAELSSIIPSNHGVIAWTYRGFHSINETTGDFVGFLSALNQCCVWTVSNAVYPIIVVGYAETWTGSLSYFPNYLFKVAIVIFGACVGLWNISMIGTSTNTIICIFMIPIVIGFCMSFAVNDYNSEDAFIGTCASKNWVDLLAVAAFYGTGYEGMGTVVGEIGFDVKHLATYFIIAIIGSTILNFMPVIAVSSVYPNCADWYIGLFAVGYAKFWGPFYYMLVFGAFFCTLALYLISVVMTARLLWAMSQPYILVNKIYGTMLMPTEYHLIADQWRRDGLIDDDDGYDGYDGTDSVGDGSMQSLNDESQYRKIKIAILPAVCGKIWNRTGAPWMGVILQAVIAAFVCLIPSYYYIVEFCLFMYWFSFFAMLGSFMIMRYKEPTMYRAYTVPGGITGAWAVSLLLLGTMSLLDIVLMIYLYDMFCVAVALNIAFILYWVFKRFYWDRIRNKIYNKINSNEIEKLKNAEFEESIAETVPLTQGLSA